LSAATGFGLSLFESVRDTLNRDRFPEASSVLPVTTGTIDILEEELGKLVRHRKLSVHAYLGYESLDEVAERLPRLRALAETGSTCYVFGRPGGEVPTGGGIRKVELDGSDLAGERFVILQGPEFTAALLCRARGPETDDPATREYECLVTLDRKVVGIAVAEINRVLLSREREILPTPKASVGFASDVARAAAGTLLMSQLTGRLDSLERRLQETSVLDAVTGLHNQRYFYMQLIREVNRFQRHERPFSIIFLEIRESNPRPGEPDYHASGKALKAMGKFLQERVRRGVDMPFRLKGNEFACILMDTGERHASRVAVRLEECFNGMGFAGLGLKVGISEFASGETIESVLGYAKRRLKQA
jgi:diguanylate cyclase (GGDEF)-like protein